MTIDVFGPANATNSVTARPFDGRQFTSTDTWYKDCTNEETDDGTDILAAWLNQQVANNRSIARANGLKLDGVTPVVAQDNGDDLLLRAIQAFIQRGQIIFGTNSGTGDAAIVAMSPVLAELVVGMQVLAFYGSANTTAAPVANIGGTGNKSVLKFGGGAPAAGDLVGFLPLVWDGTAWRSVHRLPSDTAALIHTKLTSNLTLYATAGSAAGGNGTSGSPFQTPQQASDYIQNTYDLAGFTANVLCSGAFTTSLNVSGTYTGAKGITSVTFNFQSGSSVASSGACFSANFGASYTVLGISSSRVALSSSTGSIFLVTSGAINFGYVNFGSAGQSHIIVGNGQVNGVNDYTISAGAQNHINGLSFGIVQITGLTITFSGSFGFSTAFISSTQAFIDYHANSFVGTTTANRFIIKASSYLFTGGAGASYVPGNVTGTSDSTSTAN